MNVIKNKKLKEILNRYPDEAGVILVFKDEIYHCDDGSRNIGSILIEYIEEDEFDIPTIIIKSE